MVRFIIVMSVFAVAITAASGGERNLATNSEEVEWNRKWAEMMFSDTPGGQIGGDSITIIHDDGPPGVKYGMASVGAPMRLAERTYSKGIGVNSNNTIRVHLAKPALKLLADIGIDRCVDGQPASVVFHVAVAGTDVFTSQIMRAGSFRSIEVPLNGAQTFDLIVDDAGDTRSFDQADWANARVVLEDGSILWLDDIASYPKFQSLFPFSFKYGGRHSSEFLREWICDVHDESIGDSIKRRLLTFTDPNTGLQVSIIADIYLDTPGVDWTIYIRNNGDKDTPIIEDLQAIDISFDRDGITSNAILHLSRGGMIWDRWPFEDFQPLDITLPAGAKHDFGTPNAFPSFETLPFFNVSWNGGEVITAIGWTGCWRATVEHSSNGSISIKGGMRNMRLKLHPGEAIRSPRVMQMYCMQGDEFRSYNLFRQTMLKHIVPQDGDRPAEVPITYAASFCNDFNATTEDIQLSYIHAIDGLGFDQYWLDAYWIKDGYPNGIGNWEVPVERVPDPVRFPNGLNPVVKALKDAGIGLTLWMGIETVMPNTYLHKKIRSGY